MTYRIEHFVRKIKAPIVCRMDNEELSFSDGEELAVYTFDKYYIIDSVEIEGGKAVLTLTKDWIREQKEVYDTIPNLFDGV